MIDEAQKVKGKGNGRPGRKDGVGIPNFQTLAKGQPCKQVFVRIAVLGLMW